METKKQKIVYVITKSNFGGAQRYVHDLATSLDTDTYDIAVVLGGEGILTEKLQERGIRVLPIATLKRDISLMDELRTFHSLYKIISAEKPDILHTNSSKAAILGGIIGWICFVPTIIFTAHGWAFNEERPPLHKTAIKLFHWITVLLSSTTITVSNSMKEQMDWPYAEKRMRVINPGRDISHFYTKEEARKKLTKYNTALTAHKEDIWIGTIAELHPIKRIDIAIHAVETLLTTYPNLRYVIIGDGEQRVWLQNLVAKRKLTEHVFFIGSITEAATYLPAFDVFTLTSQSESYGYVLLEAGLARVPVVASNVGGITDIVTNRESGLLVPPADIYALIDAVDSLLKEPENRTAYSEELHALATTRTVENMVQETLAVYELHENTTE
ncbi:MAG: glycosyltransferase [Candidatus Paceibacterota bacterium]